MKKFVKGEIVCSSFDNRFIGIFDSIRKYPHGENLYVVNGFINHNDIFRNSISKFLRLKKSFKRTNRAL